MRGVLMCKGAAAISVSFPNIEKLIPRVCTEILLSPQKLGCLYSLDLNSSITVQSAVTVEL